jgi:hypothetical protein
MLKNINKMAAQNSEITVYLIQSGDTDYYKIGKTRRPLCERISEIQTGNPNHVRLIASTSFYSEKFLHDKFKQFRTRGEWFLFSNKVLDNIVLPYFDPSLNNGIYGIISSLLEDATWRMWTDKIDISDIENSIFFFQRMNNWMDDSIAEQTRIQNLIQELSYKIQNFYEKSSRIGDSSNPEDIYLLLQTQKFVLEQMTKINQGISVISNLMIYIQQRLFHLYESNAVSTQSGLESQLNLTTKVSTDIYCPVPVSSVTLIFPKFHTEKSHTGTIDDINQSTLLQNPENSFQNTISIDHSEINTTTEFDQEVNERIVHDKYAIYYNESIAELDRMLASLPQIIIPSFRNKLTQT